MCKAIARALGKVAQPRVAIQISATGTKKSSLRRLRSRMQSSESQSCPRSKIDKQGLRSLNARRRRQGGYFRTWKRAPLAVSRSSQSPVTEHRRTESKRTPTTARTMRVKIRRMRLRQIEESTCLVGRKLEAIRSRRKTSYIE